MSLWKAGSSSWWGLMECCFVSLAELAACLGCCAAHQPPAPRSEGRDALCASIPLLLLVAVGCSEHLTVASYSVLPKYGCTEARLAHVPSLPLCVHCLGHILGVLLHALGESSAMTTASVIPSVSVTPSALGWLSDGGVSPCTTTSSLLHGDPSLPAGALSPSSRSAEWEQGQIGTRHTPAFSSPCLPSPPPFSFSLEIQVMPGIRAPWTAEEQWLNCLPSIRQSGLGLFYSPPTHSAAHRVLSAPSLTLLKCRSWCAPLHAGDLGGGGGEGLPLLGTHRLPAVPAAETLQEGIVLSRLRSSRCSGWDQAQIRRSINPPLSCNVLRIFRGRARKAPAPGLSARQG